MASISCSRRWLSLLALAASLAGCGPGAAPNAQAARGPAQRVWNGRDDAGGPENDWVVHVYENGERRCTGTLITPELVLTSAHCIHPETTDLQVRIGPVPSSPAEIVGLLGGTDCGVFPPDPASCLSGEPTGQWRTGAVRSMIFDDVGDVAMDIGNPTHANADVALLRLDSPLGAREHARARKPYLGRLPASGTTGARFVGYGFTGTGGLIGHTLASTRQVNSVASFTYRLASSRIIAELGSIDDPVFPGPDVGDSGGPLLLEIDGWYQQVGVLSAGTGPNATSVVLDPDGEADSGDEIVQASAAPAPGCPEGQFWDGWTGQCRDFCPRKSGAPQVWDGSRCLEGGSNFRQTAFWSKEWMNLTQGSRVNTWLESNAADPDRPGYWIGETDYDGPCRTSVDPLCGGWISSAGDGRCPNVFDAADPDRPFEPELRSSPPAIYGREGVALHDRVWVYGDGGWADVAAGSGTVHVFNDVRLGKIWGGDLLRADWRSGWTGGRLNPGASYSFVGTYPASMKPPRGAHLPGIRFSARFPRPDGSTPKPAMVLQNCTGGPDTVIAKGSYVSSLTLNGTCGVKLAAGRYYFDELVLEPDAHISVDHRIGPVEIYVRKKLSFKGRFLNVAGPAAAHVLGYFGTDTVSIESRPAGFLGTLVAPYASLVLNSTRHEGAFYAREVEVHQGAQVVQRSCDAP